MSYAIVSFLLFVGISSIVAPTETLAVNSIQQTKTQDNTGCDSGSDCRNSGSNAASIPEGDNNIVRQSLDQINRCITNSKCSNTPNEESGLSDNPVGNSAELIGDGNSVSQRIQSANNCKSSTCENKVDIEAGAGVDSAIKGSQNSIGQQVSQNNDCSDSQCQNTYTQFFLAVADNNQLTAKGSQSNNCGINSDCTNHVGIGVIVSSDVQRNLEISETNNCIRNSSCSNFANHGSHSNHCYNGSSCITEGFGDLQTTCVNGATCENIGENTNVISNSANCNSVGDNTTTFCQPGRTLTLDNN